MPVAARAVTRNAVSENPVARPRRARTEFPEPLRPILPADDSPPVLASDLTVQTPTDDRVGGEYWWPPLATFALRRGGAGADNANPVVAVEATKTRTQTTARAAAFCLVGGALIADMSSAVPVVSPFQEQGRSAVSMSRTIAKVDEVNVVDAFRCQPTKDLGNVSRHAGGAGFVHKIHPVRSRPARVSSNRRRNTFFSCVKESTDFLSKVSSERL